jgi:hypothetical protein
MMPLPLLMPMVLLMLRLMLQGIQPDANASQRRLNRRSTRKPRCSEGSPEVAEPRAVFG